MSQKIFTHLAYEKQIGRPEKFPVPGRIRELRWQTGRLLCVGSPWRRASNHFSSRIGELRWRADQPEGSDGQILVQIRPVNICAISKTSKLLRSSPVPCQSRGNQTRGTIRVRPSVKSILKYSSFTPTRQARCSLRSAAKESYNPSSNVCRSRYRPAQKYLFSFSVAGTAAG
jgi:hypothetical protein